MINRNLLRQLDARIGPAREPFRCKVHFVDADTKAVINTIPVENGCCEYRRPPEPGQMQVDEHR